MAKILFLVDVRRKAALHATLVEQHPRRAAWGETAFSLFVDDDARHVGYVILDWESLKQAHKFLRSQDSHNLVAEWPVDKVLSATPLSDVGAMLAVIEREKNA